jgi:hypothetical protein
MHAMTRLFSIVIALSIATPALAQEPVGCDKFKWPLDRERALLASAPPIASGAQMPKPLDAAVTLALVPLADAQLPAPPSRTPKNPESYAGFVSAPAIAKAGTYRVTLAAPAWIDVVQSGRALQSTAFSGASGCAGLAKSVKFDLVAAPFSVELSGTPAHAVTFVVTPD